MLLSCATAVLAAVARECAAAAATEAVAFNSPQRCSGAPSMKHSPRRQRGKRRRRRWLTRCVLGLLVAAAAALLVVHVRGDDDAARPPDEVRHARRSRPGVDLLKAETTAWLVAMREQEERASEERRQVYKHH